MGKTCLNCGAELTGPICAQCGQKEAQPLSLKRLIKDFWTQLLELDFRVFHTLKMLVTKPGYLAQNYLEGKRLPYTNPFKLLFFVATFYFFVVNYFKVSTAFANFGDEPNLAVVAFINYLVYFYLMPTALILMWLFRPEKRNWSECYVTVCYWWSGYLFLASILAVLLQFFDQYYAISRTALGVIYSLFAINQMFSPSKFSLLWKTIVFFAGYLISTGLITAGVIALAYIVNFEPLMIKMGE